MTPTKIRRDSSSFAKPMKKQVAWVVRLQQCEIATQYKYVTRVYLKNGTKCYKGYFITNNKDRRKRNRTSKKYSDIRTAAIAVDKWLIQHGKEPVNILKPLL